MGGPGYTTFETLEDWTTNADSRIKYYSGTAVYRKKATIDVANDRIYLQICNPGFVAHVFINSQDAGIVWCSPWNIEITKYLIDGENDIEIHVANSLMNRMIYDASLKENERITYAYPMIASPDDKLEPSGLRQAQLIRKR